MTAREHNKLAGIFLMAHGGMQLVFMVAFCLLYAGIGGVALSGGMGGDRGMGVVFLFVSAIVFLVSLAFAVPQILGGYKLFRERANARTWGIIGSILSCLSFPLGTAAGVYGMWFLFGDLGKQFYLGGMSQPMFQQPPQPPPPNSWQ